ncbi:MAG TPA: M23 family metallopeptidase [candidate division Zixibacteria bacterium]|nr:M23 family metallopeptidase [candidate division Zixibacteria bacterium]
MFKKKFTLMLIPGSKGILKQVNVPAPLVYGAVVLVLMLLGISVALSTQYVSDRVSRAEIEKLKAENLELKNKFEQIRWTLTEFENRYQDMVQKEVVIRTAFDLPEIDPQERQLGIGGPIPKAVESMTPAQKSAYVTERQVDRLLRLSEFELDKYSEVEQKLDGMKDRLRHTPSIWPTKGWVTTGFQMRDDPFTGYRRMHAAIDISNRTGTPIYATADGKVVEVGRQGGLGNMVVIDHGYGFKTRYAHLKQATVKKGQRVSRGEQIALMGNTGHSTGPHLHYEVIRNGKKLNPADYILNEMD